MEVLWHAASLRELDRLAIEERGLPGIALMECAGAAAAALALARWPDARRVVAVCGPGNNGGDAYVVARRLREAGLDASVLLACDESRIAGDAATMLRVADAFGVPRTDEVSDADLVVDGLFGTGFRGSPDGRSAQLIAAVADARAAVLALDVPSGVDATSGAVEGPAVRADCTVCFHGRKLGTAIEPGRGHAGEVVVADIGLPAALPQRPDALRYDAGDLVRLPRRTPTGSKYDAGAVAIVGGAPGMSGAPVLAGRAALRAGAGIVRLFVPEAERATAAAFAAELMVRAREDVDALLELAAAAGAVVVGPGLGRDASATALVERLVAELDVPLVLDADALYALRGRPELLAGRAGPTALTPHAGELARLLGRERAGVDAHRLEAVQEAARRAGCAVLLKGPDTLVAAPGEVLRVVETAVPALATAGAGDVLAGVVGALLARGVAPAEGLALAAAAHGAAARVAAAAGGTIVAGDLDRPLGRLLA